VHYGETKKRSRAAPNGPVLASAAPQAVFCGREVRTKPHARFTPRSPPHRKSRILALAATPGCPRMTPSIAGR